MVIDKPIVIYTYDFDKGVGGIKVMHKLCHLLNSLGAKSYLLPIFPREIFYTYAKYKTPLVTYDILSNLDNAIVVYPEGIVGNPLKAKNVVRWMLGPAVPETIATYSKSDLIFWYDSIYYDERLGQSENVLHVTEFHEDIFFNKKKERHGTCYTIRKAKPTTFIHPPDSVFIPYHAAGNLEEISEIFNTAEVFYCYDTYTFLIVQATLCGCLSVVVPDPNIEKEKWILGSEFARYGIAYGEDDIPRAKETLPLFFDNLKKVEDKTSKQILDFVGKCNNFF